MRRRRALAEAAVALALARLALRMLPFRWLAPSPARPGPVSLGAKSSDPQAIEVGWAVEGAAARLPWRSTCLVRALAGRLMLGRRGVPSVLCLGVAKEEGAIRAHAWLVASGGVVCGGPEAQGFTAIAAFPSGLRP